MIVTLTMDFELPDEVCNLPNKPSDPNYRFNDMTWEEATLRTLIWDGFIHPSMVQHMMMAMEMCGKDDGYLTKLHNNWANIIKKAAETYQIKVK
jgi:hypothetical protein